MSWAEVGKLNKNMKRALDEQLRDLKFQELEIITSTKTYTPSKTGLYKVICVGAGGNGGYTGASNVWGSGSGGGGGVAVKTLRLSKNSGYAVTVSTTASFVYDDTTIITATSGGSGGYANAGLAGSASGGDANYSGTIGSKTGDGVSYFVPAPGGVGVFISGLYTKPSPAITTLLDPTDGSTRAIGFEYGDCLLNYGGGGTGTVTKTGNSGGNGYRTNGKPAAIIIAPLEMEE